MLIRRILALVLVFGVIAAACGGDTVSASNCDELVDEALELFQRLIDDVDAEFAGMSMEEYLETESGLSSVEQFTDDAVMIDELAIELGCTQSDMGAAVKDRTDELTAESDLGRFLINAIRAGAL